MSESERRRTSESETLTARDVRITPATGHDAEHGVLVFASCRYGGLRIDGITVRRRLDGTITIGFPARKDGRGRRHFVVSPADLKTRESLERTILAAYRETLG